MTSYDIGRIMAPVLMFVGGLALLLSGRRGRRAAEAAGSATRGPRARVAFGVLLLFMSTVGTAGSQLTKRQELHATTVGLPPTLLGLDRDDALLGKNRAKARSLFADNLELADVGAYGDGTPALIVAAGRASFEDPEAELSEGFPRSAFPATVEIDGGHDIAAGDLGGSARCWTAEGFGNGADVCGFVSKTSIVIVVDRVAPDAAAAAARALAVRQAVVSVEGQHPTSVTLPQPAIGSSVRVALPAVVSGWPKRHVAELTGPRAEFVASATASGMQEADMGIYLVQGRAVMVQTALGRFRNPDVAIRSFAKELAKETDSPPGSAVPVAGGPHGTSVTCWRVRMDGAAVTCLEMDAQAFVAVYDLGSTNVAKTAAITRTLGAAVERRG